MKSGLASSTCSLGWVVSRPRVLQPAAFPLRMPLGASSMTRHRVGSTPDFFAPRRYGSGLNREMFAKKLEDDYGGPTQASLSQHPLQRQRLLVLGSQQLSEPWLRSCAWQMCRAPSKGSEVWLPEAAISAPGEIRMNHPYLLHLTSLIISRAPGRATIPRLPSCEAVVTMASSKRSASRCIHGISQDPYCLSQRVLTSSSSGSVIPQ